MRRSPQASRVAAQTLEIVRVRPRDRLKLASFFRDLKGHGDEAFFHPHPLTAAAAARIAAYSGRDLYYVARAGGQVAAYGMLRGWDDGYDIPSLGIAVHPSRRGTAIGLAMMQFLHAAARLRGSARIRLKVDRTNKRAFALYRRLGYDFTGGNAREAIGFLTLHEP